MENESTREHAMGLTEELCWRLGETEDEDGSRRVSFCWCVGEAK